MRSRRIRWLLGSYAAVLLLSIGLYFILASRFTIQAVIPDADRIQEVQAQNLDLLNKLYDGQPDQITNDTLLKQMWEFRLAGNRLTLFHSSENDSSIQLLAVRSERQDQRIQLTYYSTSTMVLGTDILESFPIPQVSFDHDTVTIYDDAPARVEKTAKVIPIFTVKQFLNQDKFSNHPDVFVGSRILYIDVPDGIEVVGTIVKEKEK